MEQLYVILTNESTPLAQVVLDSKPGSQVLQFHLADEELEELDIDLTGLGELQFIALNDSCPSMRGTVTIQRRNRMSVQPGAALGAEARENLRILSDFESVMYPVTGNWKGQRAIRGHDLSCGGIAFHTYERLQEREIVEVVLPVTDEPLLLRVRIIRELPTDDYMPLYASRFVDICMDEEVAIRKAVFSIQLNHPNSNA